MDVLIKLVILAVLVPVCAGLFTHLFLFKTMARMQSRLGPMEAGPHGSFQLVAEGLKAIQKEDIFPRKADRLVFGLSPVVVMASTFALFVVIPAGPSLVVEDLNIGALYVVAVASISVIGILMAGWGSASKYSMIGGLRAAAQLLAYEIPLVLAVLGVVVQAESLSLGDIVNGQASTVWFVLPQLVGFLIFLIAAQAELNQTPFDMPVAETEIVTGYMTEYSGIRFLLFFLAELATAVALSAIAVTLFLGGWQLPFVDMHGTVANIVGPFVLLAKVLIVGFVIFWVRFSMPRLKEDQLQALAWKILIPLGLINLAVTAALKVGFG